MNRMERTKAGAILGAIAFLFAGCKSNADAEKKENSTQPPFMSAVTATPPQVVEDGLPAEKTGGFDGKAAYMHVAKMVAFGPRPSGSQAIAQTQDYILSQLQSFGCSVETDAFTAQTPAGPIGMKNILVRIQGEQPGVILLGTHYDTLKKDNFVGADDGGSSTGLMLEMARLLCPTHGKYAVWIAFFDGEEAVQTWSDTDGRNGSKEMAAKFALSGDLKRIRAFLLADIIGGKVMTIKRDSTSNQALTNMVWGIAKKLGYGSVFVDESFPVEDDHDPFMKRNVPSVDVIADFMANGYWHTPQDTLDKIGAKSLGIVGHVFVESVKALQAK
ncbi:MAG TPA: M28 family peptidase [Candidatus Dormibacteraeota bacterium]|jgi:glutaminyl-peptide cyclotransferase|nr:M28 family peptidase [Candidatus Dormibacteraeota bacterium]